MNITTHDIFAAISKRVDSKCPQMERQPSLTINFIMNNERDSNNILTFKINHLDQLNSLVKRYRNIKSPFRGHDLNQKIYESKLSSGI